MKFLVIKSYDGGKRWERDRECSDFGAAADAAQELRTAHPYIRFRVDAEAVTGSQRRAESRRG